MIGWLRRLFGRPKLTLALPPRTTPVVDPQPDTLAEALADQLESRRREVASKLVEAGRAHLLDEQQAAAVLAARGEEMWREPSICAARRERLGLGEPAPVREPSIHEVAANARAQLDEAEARIAALTAENKSLKDDHKIALQGQHAYKDQYNNVAAVLASYKKSVQDAKSVMDLHHVPTETKEAALFFVDRVRWLCENMKPPIKKRRKKTTPRRRV